MTFKILLTLTLLFIASVCLLGIIGVEHGMIERWKVVVVCVALGVGSFTVVGARI